MPVMLEAIGAGVREGIEGQRIGTSAVCASNRQLGSVTNGRTHRVRPDDRKRKAEETVQRGGRGDRSAGCRETRNTSLMTSRMRVWPLPSEPTHSPWSGGSRLNWFAPADEPNRWSKWLRPSKLVMRFGFEVVTGFGWVMTPTGVPPVLWLRSGASGPSPRPAISKLSIPPG